MNLLLRWAGVYWSFDNNDYGYFQWLLDECVFRYQYEVIIERRPSAMIYLYAFLCIRNSVVFESKYARAKVFSFNFWRFVRYSHALIEFVWFLRLPHSLGCNPCVAFPADVGDECHLWHNGGSSIVCDGWRFVPDDAFPGTRSIRGIPFSDQYRRWIPYNEKNARYVQKTK